MEEEATGDNEDAGAEENAAEEAVELDEGELITPTDKLRGVLDGDV